MKMPSWWPWVRKKDMNELYETWRVAAADTARELIAELRSARGSNNSLRGVVTKLRAERNELKAELAIANKRIGLDDEIAASKSKKPDGIVWAKGTRSVTVDELAGMLGMGKGTKK